MTGNLSAATPAQLTETVTGKETRTRIGTGIGQETETIVRDAIVGLTLHGAIVAILASGIAATEVVLGLSGIGPVLELEETNVAIAVALARSMIITNEADHGDETAVPVPESIGGKGADPEPGWTGGKRVAIEEMILGLAYALIGGKEVDHVQGGNVAGLVTFV